MSQKISPAAISRILSGARIAKSSTRTEHWSRGFSVTGYGSSVDVDYAALRDEDLGAALENIADAINSRKDQKYFAKVVPATSSVSLDRVEVTIREESVPKIVETVETTEIVPDKVDEAQVRSLLLGQHYEFTYNAAGFQIKPEGDRCVRVSYADHSHTNYAFVIGGQEAYAKQAVENYATLLVGAEYSVLVDYREDSGWSALVGPAGEFYGPVDSPEDVKDALNTLREAVEDEGLSYMTRKAGDNSLFIYYLVPFKDKVRRLEVSWSQGVYRSNGRFPHNSGELRMKTVGQVVALARNELSD